MKKIFVILLFLFTVFPKTTYAQEPQILYISKLSLYLPIKISPIINSEWQVNEDKTAFFGDRSSLPGKTGTTVIFAHAKKGLFDHLPLLKNGDTITLAAKTSIFVYTIHNRQLLLPEDITFIKTDGKNMLAIFTCFGKNDTKRIVYFADLIKVAAFPKVNPVVYKL